MATQNPEENKDLVRQHFDAINQRDREQVADLHAEDVVVHSGGREVHGIEAVLDDWWAQLEAIPDLTDSIDLLLAEDDKVAIRYTTTGTHEGEFMGIEPTGESVEVTSMAVVRIEDGQIAEWWNHPDRFGTLQQLGFMVLPRPTSMVRMGIAKIKSRLFGGE
jgi:steroid delta-isomerase-like uncharacterized protein